MRTSGERLAPRHPATHLSTDYDDSWDHLCGLESDWDTSSSPPNPNHQCGAFAAKDEAIPWHLLRWCCLGPDIGQSGVGDFLAGGGVCATRRLLVAHSCLKQRHNHLGGNM